MKVNVVNIQLSVYLACYKNIIKLIDSNINRIIIASKCIVMFYPLLYTFRIIFYGSIVPVKVCTGTISITSYINIPFIIQRKSHSLGRNITGATSQLYPLLYAIAVIFKCEACTLVLIHISTGDRNPTTSCYIIISKSVYTHRPVSYTHLRAHET